MHEHKRGSYFNTVEKILFFSYNTVDYLRLLTEGLRRRLSEVEDMRINILNRVHVDISHTDTCLVKAQKKKRKIKNKI